MITQSNTWVEMKAVLFVLFFHLGPPKTLNHINMIRYPIIMGIFDPHKGLKTCRHTNLCNSIRELQLQQLPHSLAAMTTTLLMNQELLTT